jgi:hypothetical protein
MNRLAGQSKGPWSTCNVDSFLAETTSQRIGAFGRIEFDVPLYGEHE